MLRLEWAAEPSRPARIEVTKAAGSRRGPVGTLVAEVAAFGLAVAFTSPVSVVTVIVLLSMPSGRRRAIAFVCGWLVAIAGIGALAVFVLHGQDFGSRSSTPSRAASALEVLLGSLILIWAVVAYRRREPSRGANRRLDG